MPTRASLLTIAIAAALLCVAFACTPTPTAQPPKGPSISGSPDNPSTPLRLGVPDASDKDTGAEEGPADTGTAATDNGAAAGTDACGAAAGTTCTGSAECCSKNCFLQVCQ